jgi:hypothetical protein
LGAAILAQVPEAFRGQVEPFVPAIVDALHQAISLATANTSLIGIAASLLAALLVATLREVAVRHGSPAEAASLPRAHVRPIGEPGA